MATKKGTFTLETNLCLKNVLYVSQLTCNSIYISQLIDHYDCFVQFTKGLCVIQDRTLRMLIAAGERLDDSIILKGYQGTCNTRQWCDVS